VKNWKKVQGHGFNPILGDFDSDPKLEGWRREFANFETSSRFCMKNHNIEAIWGAHLL